MSRRICLLAVTALALPMYASTVNYGWEDGGTVLGLFGTGDPPIIAINVGPPDPIHSGGHSLKLIDNSPSGTPQAYVAWITGLADGDVVGGSFWRYDTTPTTSPSVRIWAHWNDDPDDVMGFAGSAGGSEDYGPGTGWDQAAHSWTVSGAHTGLVIEARTYSNPGDTVWIDDLVVSAPAGATIHVAPEPAALLLLGLGGLVLRR